MGRATATPCPNEQKKKKEKNLGQQGKFTVVLYLTENYEQKTVKCNIQ